MQASASTQAVALVWGLGGVVGILAWAIVRLGAKALVAVHGELTGGQLAFAAGWVAFMAWSEGYRGFQQRFSPICAARVLHLAEHPSAPRLLLAPLFCMGYFGATRGRLVKSWVLTSLIITFAVGVRAMPMPWRGLVDLGVVVGLSWGIASLLVSVRAASRGERVDPEVT
jgi:hypothetical protein